MSIILEIIPQHIDPAAWAEVYDDIRKLLQSHPARLLGHEERDIAGTLLSVHTLAIEQCDSESGERWLSVAGDLKSRKTGEPVVLYRDLGRYATRPSPPLSDILLLLDYEGSLVFRADTESAPCHSALLAAAMLVEARFPRAALVRGDIDRDQALWSKLWAETLLDRNLRLPVRLDAAALFERLSAFSSGDALIRHFGRLYLGTVDELLAAIVTHAGREAAERWLLGELVTHPTVLRYGARRLFVGWLNATRDLERLCQLAARDPRGPRYSDRELAEGLAHSWVAIPHEESACFSDCLKPDGWNHITTLTRERSGYEKASLGRYLRERFSREELRPIFERVFGDEASIRLAQFDTENKRIRDTLTVVRTTCMPAETDAEDKRGKAIEDLSTLPEPLCLSDVQREAVTRQAFEARRLSRFFARDEPELFEPLCQDAAHAKATLARLVDERDWILTEQAFHWILAEEDTGALLLLVALSRRDPRSSSDEIVIRALFENKALCYLALSLSRDDAAMAEVARKREENRRARQRASAPRRPRPSA